METFRYVKIEMIADTEDKRIKLKKLTENFESLAKANGLTVSVKEEMRITQSKNSRYSRI